MNRECEYLERPRAEPDFDAMDDVSEWAIAHPVVNSRASSDALASLSVRESTYVGAESERT